MTKQTDYGILLLTYFAQGPKGWTSSARELAAESHLPLPMVSKILKLLTREGLLISHRGVKGGYSLARQPEAISVAEIIGVMEGPIAMAECIGTPGDCRQEPVCATRHNWHTINGTVRRALEGITLSDMSRPLSENLVPLAGAQIERASIS
jgi:FeS assembly SUF system regulator